MKNYLLGKKFIFGEIKNYYLFFEMASIPAVRSKGVKSSRADEAIISSVVSHD